MASDQLGDSRRNVLKKLGAVATASALAGCEESDSGDTGGGGDNTDDGNNGGGNQELGERVPTISYHHYARSPHDTAAEITVRSMKEVGFNVNTETTKWGPLGNTAYNDLRDFHAAQSQISGRPSRLDPDELMMDWNAAWAGGNGLPNLTQYANCDFTNHAQAQRIAPNEERRRHHVNEGQKILSEDVASLPLVNNVLFGAYRTDKIEGKRIGRKKMGFSAMSTQFMIASDVLEGNTLKMGMVSGAGLGETLHGNRMTSGPVLSAWNHIPLSSLWEWSEDFEMANLLATGHEFSDGGKTLTVDLVEDGTFHDGSPITSADVKFTFEHFENNTDYYPGATQQDFESIETPDDYTVVFNFKTPKPAFRTAYASNVGILSKAKYEEMGADEDPENWDMTVDDYVGSGPFKPSSFQPGNITFEPHDGHPRYVPDHNLNWVVYDDKEPMVNQFMEGVIHTVELISLGHLDRFDQSLSSDQWTESTAVDFTPMIVYQQMSFGPFKHRAVRYAVGKSINRREINAVGFDGKTNEQLHATHFTGEHPWRAPEDMLVEFGPPEGDVEGAKQVLREAGFAQDDNGNWHYPPDADLSPLWPEGEFPNEENGFPCVSSDGEWQKPDDFEV